ncbi:MAG: hypothetical protein LBB49_00065 [Gracilibacteraceae bacterium]|nr:hypothetical protein [Gracilibacteraceae bacterium]
MNKTAISVIIFALAGIILILGIVQMWFYLDWISDSMAQWRGSGASEEEVSAAIKQQVAPEVLSKIISFLGFVSLLVAAGLIALGLNQPKASLLDGDFDDDEDEDSLSEEDDLDDLVVGIQEEKAAVEKVIAKEAKKEAVAEVKAKDEEAVTEAKTETKAKTET